MNLSELENRLRNHAENMKKSFDSPLVKEREELSMKKRISLKKSIIIAAAILCITGTTAFAGYSVHRYLNAKDAVSAMGDSKLTELFDDTSSEYSHVTDGDYTVGILGVTSGDNLHNYKSSKWDVIPERTYAVVSVEKADGTVMTQDDANSILATPLISGKKPWEYNIFTFGGSYTEKIIDGVLYRIIECNNIEYYADRTVYMAVISEPFIDNRPYAFDNETGQISARDDYDGTNILVELQLDTAKANSVNAEKYLT